MTRVSARQALGWLVRGSLLGGLAFMIFGPLANLALWAVATQWYFPHKLPLAYGLRYWEIVFRPTGDAMGSLATSVGIAMAVVVVALAVSVPAGSLLKEE